MGVVNRASVTRPTPRKEVLDVPGLGEVIVRGLMLSERLQVGDLEGEYKHIAQALAFCVLDETETPVFSAAEWDTWAVQNGDAWAPLMLAIRRLSGLVREDVAGN